MYWYMFILFFLLVAIWVYFYKKIQIRPIKIGKKSYFISSLFFFIFFGLLTLAGIRGGDLATSTRPINILDASRHVTIAAQADMILNTPFTLIRTIGKNKGFREYNFVSEDYIEKNIKPIKEYHREVNQKPNIVLFIL